MKAFLIPPTESDQKDTDLKAVGVKSMKIGEILNMGRESVAVTGAYKSDSHHLLHTTAHMRSFLVGEGDFTLQVSSGGPARFVRVAIPITCSA